MRFVLYGEKGCPLEPYTPVYVSGTSIDQYGNEVYPDPWEGHYQVRFPGESILEILETEIQNDGRFFKDSTKQGILLIKR